MSNEPMPRTLPYAIVDVFAERALEGNALAVFPDARGLSTDEMQRIARETNLSETTFVLPRAAEVERHAGVRVRIFTTEEELPFAGHPTLGTASWIHANHPEFRGAETIVLEMQAGRIPVTFRASEPGEVGVFGTMRQNDPVFGAIHDAGVVATAIGMEIEDLDLTAPIQTVSTGMPFAVVPLRSLEAMGRLRMPQAAARAWLDGSDAKFFYCVTRAVEGSGADWRARMQFYSGEDPATGSACGCAIAWMVRHGLVRSGEPTLLEQGVEMLRPSRIHARATLREGQVTDVFVGGRTVPVATGQLFLP